MREDGRTEILLIFGSDVVVKIMQVSKTLKAKILEAAAKSKIIFGFGRRL